VVYVCDANRWEGKATRAGLWMFYLKYKRAILFKKRPFRCWWWRRRRREDDVQGGKRGKKGEGGREMMKKKETGDGRGFDEEM